VSPDGELVAGFFGEQGGWIGFAVGSWGIYPLDCLLGGCGYETADQTGHEAFGKGLRPHSLRDLHRYLVSSLGCA
jgi:hypothetical protein